MIAGGPFTKSCILPFGRGMCNTFMELDDIKSTTLRLKECVNQGKIYYSKDKK
jgi:hypothetical protein